MVCFFSYDIIFLRLSHYLASSLNATFQKNFSSPSLWIGDLFSSSFSFLLSNFFVFPALPFSPFHLSFHSFFQLPSSNTFWAATFVLVNYHCIMNHLRISVVKNGSCVICMDFISQEFGQSTEWITFVLSQLLESDMIRFKCLDNLETFLLKCLLSVGTLS